MRPMAGLSADIEENRMGQENLSHIDKERTGSYTSPSRVTTVKVPSYDRSQDLGCGEYGSVNSCATLIREKNKSQSELPQCATVRRAMSDCSHLSVPMAVTEIYPTGTGGSQMTPNMPNFALIATACPPRVPYPHMAVQRSFTVTDDTKAAAAMSTMMLSTLMASIVLPSSPPPKRHHGSCETNFLFPVPPPAVTAVNIIKENDLKGKSFLLCQNEN